MTDPKPLSRGLARRQAILDAATELFLEQGYNRTSLSDIVSRSKGSRSTLYDYFGNKEGLLRAMIEDVTTDIWKVVGNDGDTPFTEDGLTLMGCRFVNAALEPRALAVFRILSLEGLRLPEIAEFFFERGPRTAERLLAARFAENLHHMDTIGTPEQLAQIFLGAVLGVFHPYKVLGLPFHLSEADIESHVRRAVRVFLRGIGEPARLKATD